MQIAVGSTKKMESHKRYLFKEYVQSPMTSRKYNVMAKLVSIFITCNIIKKEVAGASWLYILFFLNQALYN